MTLVRGPKMAITYIVF